MKLSICIATITSRKDEFDLLVQHLNKQMVEGVEIIHYCDNRELNVGHKRQKMLERSRGEYVCAIDDDDWVPDYYMSKIMEGIEKDVDCIGFLVRLFGYGLHPILCSISNRWDGWNEDEGGFKFTRCPNHLAVIKRKHALQIGFPNKKTGEDADFSMALKKSGLIKTEHFINEVMYDYRHDGNKSESRHVDHQPIAPPDQVNSHLANIHKHST